MKKNKLSLFTAIILNINIIIGGGFFLGAQGVAKSSGSLAPLCWITWGLILLPLVLVLAKLSNLYPLAGGPYVYSKKALGSFWGLVSGWGYFIGAIAGHAVLIHSLSQVIISFGFDSALQKIGLGHLILDIVLVLFFSVLNLANIDFLAKTQVLFALLKSIPLLAVVTASFFLFKFENIIQSTANISGFFDSIPFVIFAFLGIEVCCAIAHQIKNGEKNAGKAILISFFLIMGIYAFIQLCLLGIHGTETINPFIEIFPKLFYNNTIIHVSSKVVALCILSSYLGSFYSLFYANNWVLHSIAQSEKIPFRNALLKTNKYNVPWIILIIQGLITIIFLTITQKIFYLITMSTFAVVITYLLCSISFIKIYAKNKDLKRTFIGALATLSCGYLIFVSYKELMEKGLQYILPFLIIIGVGILLSKIKLKNA
jgi:APA family basic amino acid/polyamine antiporter